ncbi:MAG: hypothetical protein D6705_14895 [Deltaproteobacteria bacterium]|nr:MAG: hypothetical protein D6705_14895 [Deltaproteobacteria bacterium]
MVPVPTPTSNLMPPDDPVEPVEPVPVVGSDVWPVVVPDPESVSVEVVDEVWLVPVPGPVPVAEVVPEPDEDVAVPSSPQAHTSNEDARSRRSPVMGEA